MAYLQLFRPHSGTQSLRFPDHDFPVIRTCAAPAVHTPRSFQLENIIETAECPCWRGGYHTLDPRAGLGGRLPLEPSDVAHRRCRPPNPPLGYGNRSAAAPPERGAEGPLALFAGVAFATCSRPGMSERYTDCCRRRGRWPGSSDRCW